MMPTQLQSGQQKRIAADRKAYIDSLLAQLAGLAARCTHEHWVARALSFARPVLAGRIAVIACWVVNEDRRSALLRAVSLFMIQAYCTLLPKSVRWLTNCN
jgi:hypothetical protein